MEITIQMPGLIKGSSREQTIDADVEGCFAVHPEPVMNDGTWTLTHVPTGFAFLSGVLEGQARACRAELLYGALDWTKVASSRDLTSEHKLIGKEMRAKYKHHGAPERTK